MIYLNNAATTLHKPSAVTRAVKNAMTSISSPARGNSTRAEGLLFDCRMATAELFNAPSPENVVFTMNATHGLNIAINALVKPGAQVVVSGFEHNAVMRPLYHREADIIIARDMANPFAPVDISQFLTEKTEAVIINHVSNVFGNTMDILHVSRICREKSIPLIIDASQSAGNTDIDMKALNAAFISMPGHKGLYGPQGTGILLCGLTGDTLIQGGTGSDSINRDMPDYLPDRFEAGTHNMPGIAGLMQGLKFIMRKTPDKIAKYERVLISQLQYELERIPNLTVYAKSCHKTNTLSFNIANIDCQSLGDALEKHSVAVRTGLHCAPLAHETAGTIDTGTVRVSVGVYNTAAEIAEFSAILRKIAENSRFI